MQGMFLLLRKRVCVRECAWETEEMTEMQKPKKPQKKARIGEWERHKKKETVLFRRRCYTRRWNGVKEWELSPTFRSSQSTYLGLNPESYFALRKTSNCPELCHNYRLHYVYLGDEHLAAISISHVTVSKLAILFQKKRKKRKALNQAMGNILEEKLGSAESLKTYDRCFIFQVHLAPRCSICQCFTHLGMLISSCLCK